MGKTIALALAAVLGFTSFTAMAQVKIGVTFSMTGPLASLGIPPKNTLELLPKEVAGQRIDYVILDDASDPTLAVSNARKLIGENGVDAIIGGSNTPTSLAIIDVVAENKVPMLSLGASDRILSPMDEKRRWVFKPTQDDGMMARAIAEHMAAQGIKTVGFIGFADAYGESWYQNFSATAEKHGLKLVVNERYNRTDTSVMGQVMKMLAANPGAILVAGAGTPAALPQKTLKERGYKGFYYQTHGVANNDFLRVCGRDCEGTFLPASPVVVAPQLPQEHPVRASSMAYYGAYEERFGKGSVSQFGAYAWDAWKLIEAALPAALQKAKPGTPEFRAALRDGIEATKELAAANGVFTLSPQDHQGLDDRARVMVRITNGGWQYVR
ncbi:ABC transporter substrate-binding protein [Tepidiphilus thermophilus]|uniref:Amino acid/amide ABC transporter substrate-binding protein, HAAT family (TC 3.A.1.4.-) n=1 Tax=Tepidiphilus thermophilus TaxID=876478 RepID=A0A0K6IT81_9PROT|nr:amino acid/amide ABC transporter substrate-binding protein, HAAT family (TC 3.A.1.4.-) [Tepidiphilus thermophilus]